MTDLTPNDRLTPFDRDALIHAASKRDTDEIDKITDRLAEQGVCRPRDDMSRMSEWIARRPIGAAPGDTDPIMVAMEGGGDVGAAMAAHFRGVFAGAGQ